MHVAEAKAEVEYVKETKGVPTVTHLRNLGVLDKNLLAVHTVWPVSYTHLAAITPSAIAISVL